LYFDLSVLKERNKSSLVIEPYVRDSVSGQHLEGPLQQLSFPILKRIQSILDNEKEYKTNTSNVEMKVK
jgi:hypothetical protein